MCGKRSYLLPLVLAWALLCLLSGIVKAENQDQLNLPSSEDPMLTPLGIASLLCEVTETLTDELTKLAQESQQFTNDLESDIKESEIDLNQTEALLNESQDLQTSRDTVTSLLNNSSQSSERVESELIKALEKETKRSKDLEKSRNRWRIGAVIGWGLSLLEIGLVSFILLF